MNVRGKTVLLIISGGIAAYKMLDYIRQCRSHGVRVVPVLTDAAKSFVTPLSVATLAGERVHQDLFSLTQETEIGHIRLARDADMVLVAPASADLLAKMAHGLCDDLASTLLLATNLPIYVAPAMNPVMWHHPATQANLTTLKMRGVHVLGPDHGDMACGEQGEGRLLAIDRLVSDSLKALQSTQNKPLAGLKALVTAGSTHEPIDDVRYIANRSSGKQGYAVAEALAHAGAETVLISGVTALPVPTNLSMVRVETAMEMHEAAIDQLPVDIAVMVAAVGDWRPAQQQGKIKKQKGSAPPALELIENPDILASIANHKHHRPHLVVGFAAEAENALAHAKEKYQAKGCDWIMMNDVGANPEIFGGNETSLTLIQGDTVSPWSQMTKKQASQHLVDEICTFFKQSMEG